MPQALGAAILAGGLGTRLRSVVDDRPKVLASVGGRPFLSYLLDQLSAAALPKVVLCTGYLGDQVKHTYGERYGGLRVAYSSEDSPLGTAGALGLAAEHIDGETVLILNGDSYCDVDLAAFRRFHEAHGGAVSMALSHVDDSSRYGRVSLCSNSSRVERFEEKSTASGAGWINAGVYLVSRELLAALPGARPLSLERDVFPSWIAKGIYGFQTNGKFIDIGTPDSYAEAEAFFATRGKTRARAHLLASAKVKQAVAEECLDAIVAAADAITTAFRNGGKLMLCGNGGSAADCQHMAAEFVSRLTKEFERPALPAIALTTDSSFLTAFTNDINYEDVFVRQVHALGKPGDVLIGISTSGSSANVMRAVQACRELRIGTIALCGQGGGKLGAIADVTIGVPAVSTQYIQEAHLAIEHILCDLVERSLFLKEGRS